jgi:hypothetical protein
MSNKVKLWLFRAQLSVMVSQLGDQTVYSAPQSYDAVNGLLYDV